MPSPKLGEQRKPRTARAHNEASSVVRVARQCPWQLLLYKQNFERDGIAGMSVDAAFEFGSC
jgi:hypothetical protein